MNGPEFKDFSLNFKKYKDNEGFTSDTGEVLEGLFSEEKEREIKKFEEKYPGIEAEFDALISLLPDPNSLEQKEFPFAAAILKKNLKGDWELLVSSVNRVNERHDSTQHAELAVIQDAQQKIDNKHLDDYMLITTAQPCEMCAGAVRNTRVGTLVYGVSPEDLKGKSVKFPKGFKPIRTTPTGVNVDALLRELGISVFAGYKRREVLSKLTRFAGTFKEYYSDPDA